MLVCISTALSVLTLANLRFTCVLGTSRLVDMSSKLDNQLLRGSGVSDFPAPDLMSLLKICVSSVVLRVQ